MKQQRVVGQTHNTLPIIKNIGKQSLRHPAFEMDEYRSLIAKLRHSEARE
jgi:hypothetical protein|tara:strand:- start:327 stop:476 length:150 start_codon:yes stop_codon:yes gene_type:complete